MAGRSRSRRARSRRSLNPPHNRFAPPVELFDDAWLTGVRENPSIRFVDLTRVEDRRRYDPTSVDIRGGKFEPIPKTLRGTMARIVIVPERHKLARFQTYGGRYSYAEVARGKRPMREDFFGWQKARDFHEHLAYDPYPSRRLGFHLPWQVVICVRRQRRREVLHALKRTGAGSARNQKPAVRNYYSNVRC